MMMMKMVMMMMMMMMMMIFRMNKHVCTCVGLRHCASDMRTVMVLGCK